jgi:hypothetical protein
MKNADIEAAFASGIIFAVFLAQPFTNAFAHRSLNGFSLNDS